MPSAIRTRRTLITALGLVAVLFGVYAIAVTVYLAFNPVPGVPRPRLAIVGFMEATWDVVTNAALAVSGIGILRFQEWARVLILIYAGLAIAESGFGMLSLDTGKFPIVQTSIILGVPLLIWIWLIFFFTRPATIREFLPREDASVMTESYEKEEPRDSIASAPRPWKLRFLIWFLTADLVFVALHTMIGSMPLPSNYSPAQRAFAYTAIYSVHFVILFGICLAAALVYGILVRETGHIHRRATWVRALILTLFPAGYLVHVSWWASQNLY